jgi:3-hydroxyisobutyrate dehydrogenase-like beta-hydroxyacid dehydrogenase
MYIDANSVSTATAVEISQILQVAPVDFVDACILSLASRLRERGTLYLSGFRAGELSDLFGQLMRIKIAGDMPGQASAFKMIISGMPKGLVGLFVETMVFAREMGLLNEALETYNEIYPGVMEVIKRMLPTYPQHAARRGEELREVEQTMLLNGLTPCVLRAVRELTVNLAGVGWTKGLDPQQWTIAELIEEAYRDRTRMFRKDAQDTVRFSI